MNWVGGARQRVKLKNERRIQREFFERRRKAKKYDKIKTQPDDAINDKNIISQDLLFLFPPNSKEITGLPSFQNRPVNFVDLSKPKKSRIQHNVKLESESPQVKQKSILDIELAEYSKGSVQRVQKGSNRSHKGRGETPLPKEKLEKHIALAEDRAKIANGQHFEDERVKKYRTTTKRNDVFGNVLLKKNFLDASGVFRLEKGTTESDLTAKACVTYNKIKANASKKRFFPKKPVPTSQDAKNARTIYKQDTCPDRNFNSSQLFHSTPVDMSSTKEFYRLLNDKIETDDMSRPNGIQREQPSFLKDRDTVPTKNNSKCPLQDTRSALFNSSSTLVNQIENDPMLYFPNQRHDYSTCEAKIQNARPSTKEFMNHYDRSNRSIIFSQTENESGIVASRLDSSGTPTMEKDNMKTSFTHSQAPASNGRNRETRKGSNIFLRDIQQIPRSRQHETSYNKAASKIIDSQRKEDHNYPRSFGITDITNQLLNSPISNHPYKSAFVNYCKLKQDNNEMAQTSNIFFEEPISALLDPRKENEDQICPKACEPKFDEMRSFEDDSEEDRFRQEMFKRKSAFNVSFQSDSDKPANQTFPVLHVDETINKIKDSKLQIQGKLDEFFSNEPYQLPEYCDPEMPQSVPETLAEVLELAAGCSDETLSADELIGEADESDLDSDALTEDEQYASTSETVPGEDRKKVDVKEGENNKSDIGEDNIRNEKLQNSPLLGFLSPCNKATQTFSLCDDENQLSFFGSENPCTETNLASISKAVQTEALLCKMCGCLVCDLLNDIARSQEGSSSDEEDLNEYATPMAEPADSVSKTDSELGLSYNRERVGVHVEGLKVDSLSNVSNTKYLNVQVSPLEGAAIVAAKASEKSLGEENFTGDDEKENLIQCHSLETEDIGEETSTVDIVKESLVQCHSFNKDRPIESQPLASEEIYLPSMPLVSMDIERDFGKEENPLPMSPCVIQTRSRTAYKQNKKQKF